MARLTTRDTPEYIWMGWPAVVYGVFLVPVLFVLLIGINLLVWSRSSINYVFIFGKNTLTNIRVSMTDPAFRAGYKHASRLSAIF